MWFRWILLSTTTMIVVYILCLSMSYACSLSIQTPAAENSYLSNKHLKVAAEPWYPFIIFYCNGKELKYTEKCLDQDKMTYGGALWEFLEFVKLARNVTYSILRPPDGSWGVCHGVNNCTGMIGMVNRAEVDFALGILVNYMPKQEISLWSFTRSFHPNTQQGTGNRIYNSNWNNDLLSHKYSSGL